MNALESSPNDRSYSGAEDLETLEDARNYNAALAEAIQGHLVGSKNLDFGAGSGTFVKLFRSAGFAFRCVEPDPTLRRSIELLGIDVAGEIDGYFGERFSSIVMINVLEHIDDDVETLSILRGFLDNEGVLVLYVPAHSFLFSSFDAKVGHHRRYSQSSLRVKLESAGFTIEVCQNFDPLGFWVAALYRALNLPGGPLPRRFVNFFDKVLVPLSMSLQRAVPALPGKNLLVVASPRVQAS